jgi:hypothetical protein
MSLLGGAAGNIDQLIGFIGFVAAFVFVLIMMLRFFIWFAQDFLDS